VLFPQPRCAPHFRRFPPAEGAICRRRVRFVVVSLLLIITYPFCCCGFSDWRFPQVGLLFECCRVENHHQVLFFFPASAPLLGFPFPLPLAVYCLRCLRLSSLFSDGVGEGSSSLSMAFPLSFFLLPFVVGSLYSSPNAALLGLPPKRHFFPVPFSLTPQNTSTNPLLAFSVRSPPLLIAAGSTIPSFIAQCYSYHAARSPDLLLPLPYSHRCFDLFPPFSSTSP